MSIWAVTPTPGGERDAAPPAAEHTAQAAAFGRRRKAAAASQWAQRGPRRADLAGADGMRSERSADRDRRAPAGPTPAALGPGYCTGQADTGGAALSRTARSVSDWREEAAGVIRPPAGEQREPRTDWRDGCRLGHCDGFEGGWVNGTCPLPRSFSASRVNACG